MKILKLLVTMVLVGFAVTAAATPGRVDAQGCHTSKKSGYHCHPERVQTSGGEAVKERERRLKRECRGMPNAGACLGYVR